MSLIDDKLAACETLHRAIQYLSFSWGVDTPRDRMQANVDARRILIELETAVLDEVEE